MQREPTGRSLFSSSYLRRAIEARLRSCDYTVRSGKARFVYSLDGFEHTVNAVFHDAPSLREEVWLACLQDLAIACLLDLASASLARVIRADDLLGNNRAEIWARPAADALRMEALSELSLPIRYRSCDLRLTGKKERLDIKTTTNKNRVLLLIGGGKDSLYTYQLLRSAGFEVQCFYMTEACRTWQQLRRIYQWFTGASIQHRAFLNANQIGRIEQCYSRIYPTQFQVGQALFLSIPYALAHGCQYIAIGAEKSANARTGLYRGWTVNHQYEKSSAFLRLINTYLSNRWNGAIKVISPLHALYDLGIYARFLDSGGDLIDLQSSCGGSNSYRRHCGRCEKCAFVAALYCGLSSDEEMFQSMFPLNPLNDLSLFRGWYKGRFEKPRSCVGSLDELRVALRLARARGWNYQIHIHDRAFAQRAPTLKRMSHYLATHRNVGLPEQIWRRIRRPLEFDDSHLAALFRSSR